MKLIHDGQTQKATLPEHDGVEMKVSFRPLVSWEADQWRRTTGPAQIDLVIEKLTEWDAIVTPDDADWLTQKGFKVKAGDPLPINKVILAAMPGAFFELLYLTILVSSGKREEQLKN